MFVEVLEIHTERQSLTSSASGNFYLELFIPWFDHADAIYSISF